MTVLLRRNRLNKGRITEVVYLNGSENMIQDTWDDDFGAKMLGKEWTGKTIFFVEKSKRLEDGKRMEKAKEK